MNIRKLVISLLLATAVFVPMVQAQEHGSPHHGQPQQGEPQPHACQMQVPVVDFQSTKICFSPQVGLFAVIDSIECSVHLVGERNGRLDTVASYVTDNTYKRHDLKNILRPVSVGFIGQYVVVIASAQNDSAYVALLDKQLNVLARRNFGCCLYAMHFEHGQLFVVGQSKFGYDIHVIPMHGGLEAFCNAPTLSQHYRVAKQAEKLKQSDPVGIGLSAVAVAVVFLALICICLILQVSSKIMVGVQKREKTEPTKAPAAQSATGKGAEGEVYAAIAAAIHMYNEELHDEEDGIITIQKVEREWTPWNAKYYNMNHYFNSRR